jgi:uncharacterized protein YceK
MLNRGTQVALALLMCGVTAGCGTASNMDAARTPFGGVGDDLHVCRNIVDGKGLGHMADASYPPIALMICGIFCFEIIDIPFSAVGDAITLPWTLTADHEQRANHVSASDSPHE